MDNEILQFFLRWFAIAGFIMPPYLIIRNFYIRRIKEEKKERNEFQKKIEDKLDEFYPQINQREEIYIYCNMVNNGLIPLPLFIHTPKQVTQPPNKIEKGDDDDLKNYSL
ncbi:MAG: hypothetical protein KDK45_00225 [Leptospiraceae bacterium]|nr:hypothetical protein [Leptospiraceae bacterium]